MVRRRDSQAPQRIIGLRLTLAGTRSVAGWGREQSTRSTRPQATQKSKRDRKLRGEKMSKRNRKCGDATQKIKGGGNRKILTQSMAKGITMKRDTGCFECQVVADRRSDKEINQTSNAPPMQVCQMTTTRPMVETPRPVACYHGRGGLSPGVGDIVVV